MLLENYPKNPTIARYVQAGCAGFVFQGGQGFSTACWDAKKDGITNPSPASGNLGKTSEFADDDGGYIRLRVSSYYKQPYPILGKAVAGSGGSSSSLLYGKPKKAAESASGSEASDTGSANDTLTSAHAGATPAAPADAANAASAAKVPAKPAAPAQAAPEWMERLKTRLKEELAAGRAPRFALKSLRATITIKSIDAKDSMQVALAQGGALSVAWSQLQPADCANLMLAMLKEGTAPDHALAAYFLFIEGRTKPAEENLARAGDDAQKVRGALGL
jgi:hypothetical protein